MKKKILVALDNSGYAEKVMLEAVELAKLYNTELHGISVINNAYYEESNLSNHWSSETLDYFKSAYQMVLDRCSNLAEAGGVTFTQETLTGNPAEEIIRYAEKHNIQLIVLGHLGKTAAAGFVIGSVAQKVAAYSKCSTLIVK